MVETTVPMAYSADEACDVGWDEASLSSADDPSEEGRFIGTVEWVQIDIGEAARYLDHPITPEGPVADRDDAAIAREIMSWA